MASFFSICSIGNCGTSYGAEISFGNSGSPPVKPSAAENDGLSLPEKKEHV